MESNIIQKNPCTNCISRAICVSRMRQYASYFDDNFSQESNVVMAAYNREIKDRCSIMREQVNDNKK